MKGRVRHTELDSGPSKKVSTSTSRHDLVVTLVSMLATGRGIDGLSHMVMVQGDWESRLMASGRCISIRAGPRGYLE